MSLPLDKFPRTALAGNPQPVLRVRVRVKVRKPQPLPIPWVTLPATQRVLQTRDNHYCSISFNSAGRVTHDAPAEILVSAWCQNRRDKKKKIWQPCALTNLGIGTY